MRKFEDVLHDVEAQALLQPNSIQLKSQDKYWHLMELARASSNIFSFTPSLGKVDKILGCPPLPTKKKASEGLFRDPRIQLLYVTKNLS